ncbi:MAG: FtsX-like permease family protein [Actinobacteria bacterium]|nr:FtsX-like permease family protein [Actinomycetota bacterium]
MHRKLRTGLSVLAVGIGISMLIVLVSLSRGSIDEVVKRWSSIRAELWVLPRSVDVITAKGDYLDDRVIQQILNVKIDGKPVASQVTPVFKASMHLAGQEQSVWGIDPDDLETIAGGKKIIKGRQFDAERKFKTLIAQKRAGRRDYDPDSISKSELGEGLELIIDQRLAQAAKANIGDSVGLLGKKFVIVGIIETGVPARVLTSLQTIRCIKGVSRARSTFYFARVNKSIDAVAAQEAIAKDLPGLRVERTGAFAGILADSVAIATIIPDVICGISVVVSFLFILLTVYTMVLERSKEIAILRSLGANSGFIHRGIISEALLISVGGIVVGIVLSYGGKMLIESHWPLLTVDIKGQWLGLAVVVGLVGGVLSSQMPAWLAVRADPLAALSEA